MLPENEPDKQLSISITKIFNWPSDQANNNDFELVFYPEQTDWAPIIQKVIVGSFTSNSMLINAFLKISYTEDESIVIMKMFNRGNLLGQFPIDLEALREKKVQYFTFGSNQVLQINIYTLKSNASLLEAHNRTNSTMRKLPQPKIQQTRVDHQQMRANNQMLNLQLRYFDEGGYLDYNGDGDYDGDYDEVPVQSMAKNPYGYRYPADEQVFSSRNQQYKFGFADEERSNRSRITYYDQEDTSVKGVRRNNLPPRNPSYNHNYDRYQQSRPLRKNFSQKVLSLLNEVKIMKDEMSSSRITNGLRSSNADGQGQRSNNFRKDKKSMSETNLFQARSQLPVSSSSGRQGNRGAVQKHRLILDSLNVVPCDEYYDKTQIQQPSRVPDVPSTNYYYRSKAR